MSLFEEPEIYPFPSLSPASEVLVQPRMRMKGEKLFSAQSKKRLQVANALKGKGIALQARLGAGPVRLESSRVS